MKQKRTAHKNRDVTEPAELGELDLFDTLTKGATEAVARMANNISKKNKDKAILASVTKTKGNIGVKAELQILNNQMSFITIGKVDNMSNDNVNVGNVVGSVISKGEAKVDVHNNLVTQQHNEALANIHTDDLLKDISALLEVVEAQKENRNLDHQKTYTTLIEAEEAAKQNDKNTAIQKIKGIGKWGLEIAKTIGAKAIAEIAWKSINPT